MTSAARRPVDTAAMRSVYVGQGFLGDAEFDAVEEGTRRINQLQLGDVVWHLPYLARDLHGHISWAVHLQAWSAGLALPFSGIGDFYKRAIEAGVLPPWLLNQTTFYQLPGKHELPLGRLLVKLGLVSLPELQRALGIQMLIKDETGLPARIGRILSATTRLSLPDLLQAVSIHSGIPFVSVEQSLPIVERVIDKLEA